MIDSLFLDLGHDFSVSPDSLLVVQRDSTVGYPGHGIRDLGLWADGTQGVVSGRRAYFRRTDMYRFDLDIGVWKDGKRHCLVKFSVPELLRGNNFRPASIQELPHALEKLSDGLWRIGVDADLLKASIIRIDLVSQADMVDSFSTYAQLLRRIHVPSTDMRERDSTVRWEHRKGHWAINAYEKLAQSGSRDRETHGVLRLELQVRKRRSVERILGHSSVQTLLESSEPLDGVLRRFLRKRLLPGLSLQGPSTEETIFDPLARVVQRYREKGSVRWRNEALEQIGIAYMSQQIGVQGTADILAPTGPGASSTERSRHARILAKARASVLELDQSQHFHDCSSSRYTDVLKNIREIVDGRIL